MVITKNYSRKPYCKKTISDFQKHEFLLKWWRHQFSFYFYTPSSKNLVFYCSKINFNTFYWYTQKIWDWIFFIDILFLFSKYYSSIDRSRRAAAHLQSDKTLSWLKPSMTVASHTYYKLAISDFQKYVFWKKKLWRHQVISICIPLLQENSSFYFSKLNVYIFSRYT